LLFDDSFDIKFERLLEEIDNNKVIELTPSLFKEVYIDKYKNDEVLYNFLMENKDVLLDSCYRPYIFEVDKGSSKSTSFHLDIKSYIDLKGKSIKGFNSLLFQNNIPYVPNPYILIYDGYIDDVYNLIPILERVKEQERDIILITKGIDENVVLTLKENSNKSIVNVKVFLLNNEESYYEESHDFIYDLSKVLGSRLIGYETDLKRLKIGDLGYCGSVTLYHNHLRFTFNEQNNIPFLIHKRRLQRSSKERLKRLELNSYINISIGAFTMVERERRYNYIYSFLNQLEDIRGDEIVFLPQGLSVLDKENIFFRDSNRPMYIGKDRLKRLLKELHSVLNIYKNLAVKV